MVTDYAAGVRAGAQTTGLSRHELRERDVRARERPRSARFGQLHDSGGAALESERDREDRRVAAAEAALSGRGRDEGRCREIGDDEAAPIAQHLGHRRELGVSRGSREARVARVVDAGVFRNHGDVVLPGLDDESA